MQDLLEHRFPLTNKQPSLDQRGDHCSACANVTDVGSVVQGSELVCVLLDPDLDTCVFWLGMNIQQDAAGSERPV